MRFRYIFILPLLLTFLITPFFRKLAIRFKVLDYPNKRKIHLSPTPLLGGLGVYLAFVTTLLINFNFSLELKGVVIASSLIILIGFVDDIKPISATLRLLTQITAGMILVHYGVKVSFLPNALWGYIIEDFITIFWVVGITNAFNFLDGLDGLASGMAVITATALSVVALQTHQPYLAYLSIALAGAVLGFLPYNFYRAKIFLGDSGSSFLGFNLAALAVMGKWSEGNLAVALTAPILILGVLIFDMIYINISRVKQHKVNNFKSLLEYVGKDHLHHRLLRLGFNSIQSTLFIYLLSSSLCLGAIALTSKNSAMFLIIQAMCIFTIVATLMHIGKKDLQR